MEEKLYRRMPFKTNTEMELLASVYKEFQDVMQEITEDVDGMEVTVPPMVKNQRVLTNKPDFERMRIEDYMEYCIESGLFHQYFFAAYEFRKGSAGRDRLPFILIRIYRYMNRNFPTMELNWEGREWFYDLIEGRPSSDALNEILRAFANPLDPVAMRNASYLMLPFMIMLTDEPSFDSFLPLGESMRNELTVDSLQFFPKDGVRRNNVSVATEHYSALVYHVNLILKGLSCFDKPKGCVYRSVMNPLFTDEQAKRWTSFAAYITLVMDLARGYKSSVSEYANRLTSMYLTRLYEVF